ncbi:MAG: DsbC family protein [Gammaproteobacteria bacterium]
MVFRTLVAVAAALFVQQVSAAGTDETSIRARMAKMFPDEPVSEIAPSPVPGLYEVMLGASLFYMTADGRYAVRGDVIDLQERRNVSEERRADARQQAFADIDKHDVIEFAPPADKRRATLYVYTDVDCGYCRKLHNDVPALNEAGIAVEYLAFPRAGLKSESYKKIAAVWCSPNRQQAMTAAKAGEKVTAPPCENPVARQFELGQAMGVSGTPAVYSAKGEELGGYVPAPTLIKMLADGKI